MKSVTVRISGDGQNVKVEADGFSGEGCLEATRGLIEGLGLLKETKPKDELYLAEAQPLKQSY